MPLLSYDPFKPYKARLQIFSSTNICVPSEYAVSPTHLGMMSANGFVSQWIYESH